MVGPKRRHIVLELGELGDEVRGKQVGPGAQGLAELHEGRPELFEGEAQAAGRRQTGLPAFSGQGSAPRARDEAQAGSGVLEAVLHQNLRDGAQAAQLAR
jgi:hypothetical protein